VRVESDWRTIAGRYLDRPVAEALVRVEDLPIHRRTRRGAQAALRYSRGVARRRFGMAMRRPSTRQVGDEPSTSRASLRRRAEIFDATRRASRCRRKRRYHPVTDVPSTVTVQPLEVGPDTGSRRDQPCGFGTMSRMTPSSASWAASQSARNSALKPSSSSASRVDDVVPCVEPCEHEATESDTGATRRLAHVGNDDLARPANTEPRECTLQRAAELRKPGDRSHVRVKTNEGEAASHGLPPLPSRPRRNVLVSNETEENAEVRYKVS